MDEDGNPPVLTDEQMGVEPEPTGNEPEAPEPKEPEVQDDEQEEEIAQDPVEEQEPEEPEPPVSRRESKRIEQLLDKLHKHDESRQTPVPTAPAQVPKPGQPIIPEGDYDLDQVNTMAQDYATKLYQQGLSQAQAMNIANTFATRLEIDAPRVTSKYTFLDQESEDFNPGPSDFISRMYLNTVGYDQTTGTVQNSNLRWGEFVEGFMDVVDLVANGKIADSSKNIAKQSARTGIRPGGPAKKVYDGGDPSKMTTEQLNAAINAGLGIK